MNRFCQPQPIQTPRCSGAGYQNTRYPASYCANPYNQKTQWPEAALTPKTETKAADFIRENPSADGTGIVIAIMDTGVDPGAEGLMITSTGQVKVIERYDCSGAGDVDISTVVTATASDGKLEIIGRTGRKLVVPHCWANPSGEYHVGFKPLFELYPRQVLNRMLQERRDRIWTPGHNHCLLVAQQKLTIFRSRPPPKKARPLLDDLERQNLEAGVGTLHLLNNQYYEDLGPMIDCVAFKDPADIWRVSLSTEQVLEKCPLVGEYTKVHEYCNILPTDRYNLSVNVWDDEQLLLEIVGFSDSHGTHVAAISAAYYPSNPNLNGVAPGAQIISLTIGDNRLGSSETGTTLTRAMTRVLARPDVHIINMSYGEYTHWAPDGKLVKMMKEVVDEKGIVWCVAAGNEGPALSTLNTPCWLSEDIMIGVGAYLSPEMMIVQYSLRTTIPATPYNFSSRGPALDGSMCVHVCAPGGAVSALPTYTLEGTHQFHGTSMATPHCSGCIALMLSLARQRGVGWTPYSVKTCLTNTAVDWEYPDPFPKGYGLIQVPEAYQMLEYLSSQMYKVVRFNISCSGGCPGYPMTGIYIRDPIIEAAQQYEVVITPKFFRSRSIDPQFHISFNKTLTLSCSAPWVSFPEFIDLHNFEQRLFIRVDPELLSPGVYYTRIEANDDEPGACLQRVFSIFATIVIPIKVDTNSLINGRPGVNFGTKLICPGCIKRYFVSSPIGTTWGVLNIRNNPRASRADLFKVNKLSFQVHIRTILPGVYDQPTILRRICLDANEYTDIEFPTKGGKVVEIAICRNNYQDNLDSVSLSIQVWFRGLTITETEISTSVLRIDRQVDIVSHLAQEDVFPRIYLTHQVQVLRPVAMSIRMREGPREQLAQGKYHHELHVTYEFNTTEPTSVTLECPILHAMLYEADYTGQLWMLFDHNKQYLSSGDSQHDRWECQLVRAGKYYARLQVRHEDIRELYRFMIPGGQKSAGKITPVWTGLDCPFPLLPILLRMKLNSAIELQSFYNRRQARRLDDDHEDLWPVSLHKNHFMTCYIRTTIDPENLKELPGSSTLHLEGTVSFCADLGGARMDERQIKVTIPSGNIPKAVETPTELLNVLVHTLPMDDSLDLYSALKPKYDSWELHLARMECLIEGNNVAVEQGDFASEAIAELLPNFKEIVVLADLILSKIDQTLVLNYFGMKRACADAEDQGYPAQREGIIKALVGKGQALITTHYIETGKGEEVDTGTGKYKCKSQEILDQIYATLLLHVEQNAAAMIDFTIEYLILRNFYALSIKFLMEKREKYFVSWYKKWDLKLRACYVALDWGHCLFLHDDNMLVSNPPDFRPF